MSEKNFLAGEILLFGGPDVLPGVWQPCSARKEDLRTSLDACCSSQTEWGKPCFLVRRSGRVLTSRSWEAAQCQPGALPHLGPGQPRASAGHLDLGRELILQARRRRGLIRQQRSRAAAPRGWGEITTSCRRGQAGGPRPPRSGRSPGRERAAGEKCSPRIPQDGSHSAGHRAEKARGAHQA